MAWSWINSPDEIDAALFDFTDDINSIVEMLTIDISADAYGITSQIVGGVNNSVYVIGLNLAVLFFLLSFLKKSVMFEFMSTENLVKTLLLFFLAKMFLENATPILGSIYFFVCDIINLAGNAITHNDDLKAAISDYADEIKEQMSGGTGGTFGPLDTIAFNIKFMPVWLVMAGARIGMWLIVYGRIIEIYIHQCVAPIPMATLVSEDLSHIGIKFIKSYCAVCLQGLIILVLCYIYEGLMLNWIGSGKQHTIGIGGFILCNLVFVWSMTKTGNWASKITGNM